LLFGHPGAWTTAGYTAAGGAKVRQANGEGLDNNSKKDFLVRLDASPIEGLDLGVSGYFGKNTAEFYNQDITGDAKNDTRMYNLDKKRYGLDVQWVSAFGTSVKAEYVKGEDGPIDSEGLAIQVAHRVTSQDLVAVMYDKMDRTGEMQTEYYKACVLHDIDSSTRLRVAHEIGRKKAKGADITTVELMKSF